MFNKEIEFENSLIELLQKNDWKEVINYPTEEVLLNNWAKIIFEKNRQIDRLNDVPLTSGEIKQILDQINELKTPVARNKFIIGKSVPIVRDNPLDKEHFNKTVNVEIFNKKAIGSGSSVYQIARQPKFNISDTVYPRRRGDVMLLINGIPVIHIELKKTVVPVSEACNQIQKYAFEGAFSGIFSLIQVFVAMTPEKTLYFANPGKSENFNPSFYFNWADFDNEPINDWKTVTKNLLYTPTVHKMIGFYTIADDTDGILKVLRSYQYYAANAISDTVTKKNWDEIKSNTSQLGGFIWHTTGSGKTMTSFKAAQLIASNRDADKVVFLTDRIELGTQSFNEYNNFADDSESVQDTANTYALIGKLKSIQDSDMLIVTSIQKMSGVKNEEYKNNDFDIAEINKKRLVFIVDECHRSTFGDMLTTIKHTFPNALFFGFSGTPIFEENQKKLSQTSMIFGGELHRYVLTDGIRDKNVLGFDPRPVLTFKENDIREKIALSQVKASSLDEIKDDEDKKQIYYNFMDSSKVPMAGLKNDDGSYKKGIEDFIPNAQYITEEHQNKVVSDILDGWQTLSRFNKFHAIFATSSIPEAIDYYRIFKKLNNERIEQNANFPKLKITCLFDPHIGNDGWSEDHEYSKTYKGQDARFYKEEGLKEILTDYNALYKQTFTMPTHALFKKDVSNRLAHKNGYEGILRNSDLQLDLLIVVDQMLTGFDSKWINTLYMDKILVYENLIQAISRTNRLYKENEKPYGIIKYYRKPFTMKKNLEEAVKTYSGDKPTILFVQKLPENLKNMQETFAEISEVFNSSKIENFEKLPEEQESKAKFAKLFNKFNSYLNAAKLQGFTWEQQVYSFEDFSTGESLLFEFNVFESEYTALVQRYKDLSKGGSGGGGIDGDDVAFDLKGYITEINTDKIDANYMNSKFKKYLRLLNTVGVDEKDVQSALEELYKTFGTLTQDQQKFAEVFLHDVQSGQIVIDENLTFYDYITKYQCNAKNNQLHIFAQTFGLDEQMLKDIMNLCLTESNIDEFGRFTKLKETCDKTKAKEYFEKNENVKLLPPKVNMKLDKILRDFILQDGIDLE